MSNTENNRLIFWRRLAALLRGAPPIPTWSASQWDALISLADELRLAPLLEHTLRAQSVHLPTESRVRLHRAARKGALARICAERTLAEIQVALGQQDIRFIVLKGLALGYTLYPTPDCRPMSDVDLVIDAANRVRATTALCAEGWKGVEDDHEEISSELEMRKADPGLLPIELHWELMHFEWFSQSAQFRTEDIWAEAGPCRCGQTAFLMLSPEDALIYLCLHLAIHHAFEEMWLLMDLDRLIRASNLPDGLTLDWDRVTRRARTGQVANAVYFTLAYAQRLLDTPAPAYVMAQLRPSWLIAWCVERLAPPERCITGSRLLGPQALRVLHFLLVDRPRDRLAGTFRAFFPGKRWLIKRYGRADAGAILAYGLWHPLRITGLGLKAVWQLVATRLKRETTTLRGSSHA